MSIVAGPALALAAARAAGPAAQAAPNAWVLNTNQTLRLVDLSTNTDAIGPGVPFASDSLASAPSGQLFSADPAGVIWSVMGAFPIGSTQRTQIGDLTWGSGGLWGYSNASQELFFVNLSSASVTYAVTLVLPPSLAPGAVVTGVAPGRTRTARPWPCSLCRSQAPCGYWARAWAWWPGAPGLDLARRAGQRCSRATSDPPHESSTSPRSTRFGRTTTVASIMRLADPLLESDELPMEVEDEQGVISQYPIGGMEVTPSGLLFYLGTKHTACPAPEKCGVDGTGCC